VNKVIYVVMGVSGSGKSLIGAKLAHTLGLDFLEGDDFHPTSNIQRMASGIPLTDDHRAEWLNTIAKRIRESHAAGVGVVISCSALKRAYRDILRAAAENVQFIFLDGSEDLVTKRIAGRDEHFMPQSLLSSQFSALEKPSLDERVWMCDINDSPDNIVAGLVARARGESP